MPTIKVTPQNFGKHIDQIALVIKNGGLILFPSDTVYILAVDVTNPTAVKKLLGFKNRWTGKAISIAVCDIDMAKKYVKLSEDTEKLYRRLLPGPFTIVSPGLQKVAIGIEAENNTLGIRIPNSQYILQLVKKLNIPISATSANLSGRSPHYSVSSLLNTLSQKKKDMLDLVIDAGKLPKNLPSTVIDATESELKILRRGDLIPKNSTSLLSTSEIETGKIAKYLFSKINDKKLTGPIVLGLSGDLGCGKTVFSQSLGKILGIKDRITSPTFVIVNDYGQFLHFDLYRLTTSADFKEIKFKDYFKNNIIACVEWPENMGQQNLDWLKQNTNYFPINFEYVSQTERRISFDL
ncbi:MAG: L-threonylcarbamoyladenylate synthase [Candidatus Shapirobacteria bacterium]